MIFYTPKNFKKGRLIALRYRPIDILIFACGASFSLITLIGYLMMFNKYSILILILLSLPVSSVIILVMIPFNQYHNMLEYLRLKIRFITSKRNYEWEGIYKYEDFK